MARSIVCTRRDALKGLAGLPLAAGEACAVSRPGGAVSVLDYIPASHHAAIAAGNSPFDCAAAIQRAIDETASVGATLTIPAGRYPLVPATPLNHADPAFVCRTALVMRSGMRIRGAAGARFRIADGWSTDAQPRAMAMFGSDRPLQAVALDQLVLDMNGANNPISPARAKRQYSRAPQAHIFVSGPPRGEAARIDDVRIADCRFVGSNGVSCIVMGQTRESSRLGRGWRISDCDFVDNGDDTDDHSSIYGYADDVVLERCNFSNRRPFDGTGGNTCYEVHGSRHTVRENDFRNYMRGIWVADNAAQVVTGTRITGNRFEVLFVGVDFFRDSDRGHPIVDTRVSGNSFRFDDTGFDTAPLLNLKACVQIASPFAQRDVVVTGNDMTKTGDRVASAFVVVTGGAQGGTRHDRISATGNRGTGMTFGSFIRTAPTAGLGAITITNNTWTDLTPAGAFRVATGDGVEQTGQAQPIASLTLGGGSVIETRPGRRSVPAVVINGLVDRLTLSPVAVPRDLAHPLVLGGTGRIVAQQGELTRR